MNTKDRLYWIWFQLMFGIGSARAHALMEYFAHPGEIADGIRRRDRVLGMLREEELTAWELALEKARELEARTLAKGCDILTPDSAAYPPLLRNIYAAPAALYVKGDLTCLGDTLVMGMVGTRNYTDYGKRAARLLAGGLAEAGAVVVSGLARGIDTICHAAALAAGGKTVGILGCGLDVDYPKGSAALKGEMAENGAVLSEFPLGYQPLRGYFPMRNRLISGMSHGVIVVEADLQSGSMITASHAAEQNREVFAVPGDIFSVRSQGAHQLIQEGAKLTACPRDVLEEFSARNFPGLVVPAHKTGKDGADREESGMALAQGKMPPTGIAALAPEEGSAAPAKDSPPARRELPPDCTPDARDIYALMGERPVPLETIAAGSPLEIGRIQTALTELEIYGLIKGYPGRRFSL